MHRTRPARGTAWTPAGVLLLAGLALPAVSWAQSPMTVVAPASASTDTFAIGTAMGARGAAVVAWTTSGTRERVHVARRAASGARFSRPRTLAAGRLARVALSPDGRRAAVTWVRRGVPGAAVMDPRGRWRIQALPAPPRDGGAEVSAVAVDAKGTVTVVVEQRTSRFWRAFVLRSVAGRWRTAASLSASDVGGGSLTVTPSGAVAAAWLAPGDDDALRLMAADLAAGAGAWSTPRELTRDEGLVQPFSDAADPAVRLVLAGREEATGGGVDARVFVSVEGGRTWEAAPVSARAAVGTSRAGVVWSAVPAGRQVTARRLAAGSGEWGATEVISRAPAAVIAGPGLQRVGTTLAAWWVVDGPAGGPDRWFVAMRGPSGWTRAVQVARSTGIVAFAGGPQSLIAAYVDRRRVVVRDLAAPASGLGATVRR